MECFDVHVSIESEVSGESKASREHYYLCSALYSFQQIEKHDQMS